MSLKRVIRYCAVLDCYAESSGNSLPTFRDNLSVTSSRSLTLKEGTDRLSRNVGKELLTFFA